MAFVIVELQGRPAVQKFLIGNDKDAPIHPIQLKRFQTSIHAQAGIDVAIVILEKEFPSFDCAGTDDLPVEAIRGLGTHQKKACAEKGKKSAGELPAAVLRFKFLNAGGQILKFDS